MDVPRRYDRTIRFWPAGVNETGFNVFTSYSSIDPLAIRFEFPGNPHEANMWYISRDLVLNGIIKYSGEGVIQIFPMTGRYMGFKFPSKHPSGSIVFTTTTEDIRDFIRETKKICPIGEESSLLDIDVVVDKLLA